LLPHAQFFERSSGQDSAEDWCSNIPGFGNYFPYEFTRSKSALFGEILRREHCDLLSEFHAGLGVETISSDPTPQKTPQTTTNGNYQTDWNGQDSLRTKDYNDQTDTSKQVANYS